MLRLSLDYPSRDAERELLTMPTGATWIATLKPCMDAAQIEALRATTHGVPAQSGLIDYLQALLAASRVHPEIRVGLSPRAGLALLQAARAVALLSGRDHVLPEDLQTVFVSAAAHRLTPEGSAARSREALARALLADVPVR